MKSSKRERENENYEVTKIFDLIINSITERGKYIPEGDKRNEQLDKILEKFESYKEKIKRGRVTKRVKTNVKNLYEKAEKILSIKE